MPKPQATPMHPNNCDAPDAERLRRQASELVDAQPQALDQVLQSWHDDTDLRQTWHAYQLIGDVLRSQDLAQSAAADEQLLQRVRAQLAIEPALLAPSPQARWAAAGAAGSRAWRAFSPTGLSRPFKPLHWGGALAAGVAALAMAVLWPQEQAAEQLAAAPSAAVAGAGGTPLMTLASSAGTAPMIRDARLDEFLRMHQMARGGGAMLIPGTGMRRVDLAVPDRNGP